MQATFGIWLKERRQNLDLTQNELARRVGCSLMLIRKIEAGERRPSKQIAALLALQLNIPLDEHADFARFARSSQIRFPLTEKSPWRSLHQHLSNLPVPPAPLFGREQDIATIVRRIVHGHVRLLTYVGPPGVGKTRLAIACADQLLDHFDDGVFFIALAPLRDPDLLAATIARTLDIKEIAGQSFLKSLTQHLAGKRLLLVLDNFEQIVAAAPVIAELLTNCPWLYVLVTSRVSLHLRAERQFRVTPLALPPLTSPDDSQQLIQYSAVQFFVDRAHSAEPSFCLSAENASAIAQICAWLDGLPLAIELVATRVGTVPWSDLLAQVKQRFIVTTPSPQDLPTRHQSLRQALDWSYDLLDASERTLFARLAVFVGGCTAQAVEQVCGELKALPQLVDQSLIRIEGQRYWMLETIREYALERLEESGAADNVRERQASYFLDLAQSVKPELARPYQKAELDQLEHEHYNLRAALRWTLETGNTEKALELSGALWRFWRMRGYVSEGLQWLQAALNLKPLKGNTSLTPGRAKVLLGAGWLQRDSGDFIAMKNCFEEGLQLCRQVEDAAQLAYALYSLGYANYFMGDHARGIQIIEESVALYRTLSAAPGIALPLNMLGRVAAGEGDYEHAQACFTESLQIEREWGTTFGAARILGSLGEVAIYRGDYAKAAAYLEEGQAILQELGEQQLYGWMLIKRGELAWRQGDLATARSFLETSLDLSREIGYQWNTAYTLTYMGLVTLSEGDAERAQALCEDSLRLCRELKSEEDLVQAQKDLARVLLQRGESARAEALYQESLGISAKRNYIPDIAECLEGLATLRGSQGAPLSAVRLFGAAEVLREKIGAPLPPVLIADYQHMLAALRAQLDEPTYAKTWAEGCALSPKQAIECAGG